MTAFEDLFLRHRAQLAVYARKIAPSKEDAEDLLQVAALNGFKAYNKWKRAASFTSWMYRIMVNAQISHIRSRSRRISYIHLEDMRSEAGTPFDQVDPHATDPCEAATADARINLLLGIVDSMPPKFREVYLLRRFAGESVADVSERLQLCPGTVKSRLNRAEGLLEKRGRNLTRGERELLGVGR